MGLSPVLLTRILATLPLAFAMIGAAERKYSPGINVISSYLDNWIVDGDKFCSIFEGGLYLY